jgi:predicted transcriptional regulator
VRVRGFGELEAVVMDLLWSWNRPATVRDVVDHLRDRRQLAYTTVMTVMDNLHRKGALVRELDGRAYSYQPAQTREQHVAALLAEVLETAQDRTAALIGFVDSMSPDEVSALRRALARVNRRRRS